MSTPSSDASQNSNPVISAYESFARETPLVTRYMIQTLVIGYLISFIFDFTSAITNIPFLTVYRFEIYRLIFAPFFSGNILTVLFGSIAFSTYGKLFEYSKGSTNFGVMIFMIGLLSNMTFVFLCILHSLITHENDWLALRSIGPFTIIPGLMALECSLAPPGSKRKLLMCEIQTMYFPVVITFLWFIFSGDNFVLFISMGVGYLYAFGRLQFLRPNLSRRKTWENTWLRKFTIKPGWIVGSNVEEDQLLPLNNAQIPAPSVRSTSTSQPFPMTGGRKLGGDSAQRRASKPTAENARETALAAAERRAAEAAESQRDVGKNEP